jgi:hypothetical protein
MLIKDNNATYLFNKRGAFVQVNKREVNQPTFESVEQYVKRGGKITTPYNRVILRKATKDSVIKHLAQQNPLDIDQAQVDRFNKMQSLGSSHVEKTILSNSAYAETVR